MRPATLLAILVALALLLATAHSERAFAAGAKGPVTVIAVDLGAASRTARDGEVALSAGIVIASTQKTGTFALLTYAGSPSEIEAYKASGPTGPSMARLARAIERSTPGTSDQMKAMSAAFQYLSDLEAPAGSRLFVITSDGMSGETAEARERVIGFASLFATQQWPVDVVMLPESSPGAREHLARLAEAGAGRAYDAGILEGLAGLIANHVGVLGQPAIETRLEPGEAALARIDVAPRTERIAVTFFRYSPAASIELFDPRGARSDAATNPAVTVFETPAAVVVEVDSPEAGPWMVRAAGGGSEVLVAVRISNPLTLEILPQPPLPAGQPGVLAAAASIEGVPVALPGATVEATVRGKSGEAVVYRLLDDGRGADQAASDGIFSVALPATGAQAIYELGLTLSWPNYDAVLTASGTLQVEQFPGLKLTALPVQPLQEGAETALAWVELRVGEYPYPVTADRLSINVLSGNGGSVASRVIPVDPLQNGSSWQFLVIASPAASGRYTVNAKLETTHLGRAFATTAPAAVATVELLPPPPLPGTPAWVYAAAVAGGLLAVLVMALGVNARRPAPAGYLYDDKGRVVYDFSAVQPSLRRRLLSRNHVACAEIPDLPVTAGTFVFGKRGVELKYPGKAQSLRVNGRPAGSRVRLTPGTWLGIGGHLMTYSPVRMRVSRTAPQAQADVTPPWPTTPPVRRVLPGFVPGRPQARQEDPAQDAAEERVRGSRREGDEPPAEDAAPSPAPAGD